MDEEGADAEGCVEVFYGYLHVRPEWLLVEASESPEVANTALSVAAVTREAVRLFRNCNLFLQGLEERGEGLMAVPTRRDGGLEAHKRSLKLLESWLTSEQLVSFKARGFFEVVGGSTGHFYRLHSKYAYGILPLGGPFAGQKLCVVPRGAPALGDILLAQKIGLETDERATLSLANVA